MAWIKDGRYYQHSYRSRGRVRTLYFGRAAGPLGGLNAVMINEHEMMLQERRELRAALRAERAAEAEALAEVRGRCGLVDTLARGALAGLGYHKPKRHRWRKQRMIKIDCNKPPANLAEEARSIVESLDAKPKGAMRKALIRRLEEIGKISPQAVLDVTSGDLFKLLLFIFAAEIEKTNPGLAIGLECKLQVVLDGLVDGSENTALRLAAEVATFAYLEVWMANMVSENRMSESKPFSPELERRQNFTQRRFLRALSTVEEIRQLTRPRRLAMEF